MPELTDIHSSQQPSHELIVRIDERTRTMRETLSKVEDRLSAVEKKVSDLAPVRPIVFGAVGLVLVAVITALLGYVMFSPARKEVIREVPQAAPSSVQ